MELFTYFDLRLIYLVIYSLGIAIGSGAAILSGLLFITSIRDNRLSKDEYRILTQSKSVVWFGIILYAFSGIGLFTLSYATMLSLGVLYADITIATALIVNALAFKYHFLPRVKEKVEGSFSDSKTDTSNFIVYLVISETVSVVSWVFIILHYAMYTLPAGYALVMGVYLLSLLAVGWLFYLNVQAICTQKNTAFFKNITISVAALSFGFMLLAIGSAAISTDSNSTTQTSGSETGDYTRLDEVENSTFTPDEVAVHNNIEDCWVIIDEAVYDVTPAAEKYPEVYACGQDTTENYRKVRDEGVSDRVLSYQIGLLGFSAEEIATHNTNENCWLVIDGLVFDATQEAMLHPAAFNCGTEVSKNYHQNHGDDISDRMMKSHIGVVDDGVAASISGNPEKQRESLSPYRELYVEEGDWDNDELMVIVEKDAEKLLFIDGKTNRELGRIHDIGFQPHTSVYSPDAKYMFIVARDGWLTKIDLDTLEPVKSIRVGESSRGTALTDDGKYLAIGNYIPGNVVMVDPESLEILKTIPTIGDIDGKEVESRVGAMIEDGEKIIVALKDLNSVWIIDTAQPDFPIIAKHWNIGGNATPLHDAFLSSDGKYYIVASMGSNTVWVMDTDTWEPVKEIPTGETPHTGPGATWGNKIYIPALGEGLITVIDMTTWEPVASIKTGGPGLFVRSFTEDPEYPYVWTETAFGENNDEIYVIDARIDEIIKTIRPVEGESSWHPEFTNDGSLVYVVSQTANEVEVYDAWTFELVKTFEANTPSAVSNVGNRVEEKGL